MIWSAIFAHCSFHNIFICHTPQRHKSEMKHDSKETQMFSNLLSTKCCFKHTVLFKVIFPQRIMWMTSQAPFSQVHKQNECLREQKNWLLHDSCWSNNIDRKESEQKRIDTKRKLKVKIFWNLFLIRSVLFAFSMWTVLNSRVWALHLLVDSMLQVLSWIETNSASTKLSKNCKMQIQFSVNGDVQLSRNLRVLVTQLSRMSEFYSEAIDIVADKSDRIFKTAGTNVEKSPTWKTLAPSTLRAREKRWWYYKNSPRNPWTLRWTWNLQENRTINVTNDRWSFTFNAPYANYHQEGWKRLPKRAILDIDNTTGAEIVRSMQKKINRDIWISWLQA